ncbi:MAG: rhodanese-like domain-containing protein [bacterium]|nr:rhodanese-like domain-containing protein [bacterium]
MKKYVLYGLAILCIFAGLAGSSESRETAAPAQAKSQNALGAMAPEQAFAYMRKTENLIIVDVAAAQWYQKQHFEGAVHIPIEELNDDEEAGLYKKLPSGRPVIVHCRLGMIAPGAYERLKELRPDIPAIAYIDGAPLFDEYNSWLSKERKR